MEKVYTYLGQLVRSVPRIKLGAIKVVYAELALVLKSPHAVSYELIIIIIINLNIIRAKLRTFLNAKIDLTGDYN